MEPLDSEDNASVSGSHAWPEFVVCHTPPPAAARNISAPPPGTAARSQTRPDQDPDALNIGFGPRKVHVSAGIDSTVGAGTAPRGASGTGLPVRSRIWSRE